MTNDFVQLSDFFAQADWNSKIYLLLRHAERNHITPGDKDSFVPENPHLMSFLAHTDKVEAENDDRAFEDEFAESNAVPYKVELTFRISDPEGRSYRSNTAPVMRIVRIPIHEQSLDGASTPGESQKGAAGGARGGGARGGGQ